MDIELPVSAEWKRGVEESDILFLAREKQQRTMWKNLVHKYGQCYMIKFDDNDIRPMWEDQIDVKNLIEQIKQPTFSSLSCPLCQPYDMTNERTYLTKIINPDYPEGFVDKAGVWKKCVCILKGEERRFLKFKRMQGGL